MQERFQSYMDDPEKSEKATKLFHAAYPPNTKVGAIIEDEGATERPEVDDSAMDHDAVKPVQGDQAVV